MAGKWDLSGCAQTHLAGVESTAVEKFDLESSPPPFLMQDHLIFNRGFSSPHT